jgi:MFS family permease
LYSETVVSPIARGLPRAVYVLQTGVLVNAFGNGAANPFMLLYLSEVRGIPLVVAGLASATAAACALASTLVSGRVADRLGPRATALGGLALSTMAFALYPLIREGWQAIALAVLLGSGAGAWLMSQSALLAALAPPDRRAEAFGQQRVAANVGLGLGGLAGGLIVTTADADTFTALFLLNAVTFVGFSAVLLTVPSPRPVRRGAEPTGYAEVFRDRVFVGFAALNVLFVAAAVSLLVGLVPVFAKTEAGAPEDVIGLLFLLNSLAIVLLQVPIAQRQHGRSRMRAFALMGVLFAVSWMLVLGSAWAAPLALLAAAFLVFSLGECLYDAVQGPLTADLAPEGMVGRYMAVHGFSWQLGFITGPAVGAAIMGAEPYALWPLAAAACLAGSLGALALERSLPQEHRLTPATVSA